MRWSNVALAAGATSVFLVGGEIGLRLLGLPRQGLSPLGGPQVVGDLGGELRPWQEEDPDVLWTLRPRQHVDEPMRHSGVWRITTDDRGFRGADLGEPLPRPLVLCAGDSVTFGFGVDDDEAYPAVLQGLLRLHAGLESCRVVNAGVSGYSSEQGRVQLSRLVPELRPDVVIACFGINDAWPGVYPDTRLIGEPGVVRRTQRLLGKSRIYTMLRKEIVLRKLSRAAARSLTEPRVAPERYRANLDEIVELSTRGGAAILLVAPTSKHEHHQRSRSIELPAPISVYRRTMASVAHARGVTLLDLPLLSGRLPESPGRFMDWCHPDAEGLCLLAQELAPLVESTVRARDERSSHP